MVKNYLRDLKKRKFYFGYFELENKETFVLLVFKM